MTGEYPKKYWWLILIVVPIIVAIVSTFPSLISNSNGEAKPPQILIFQATPPTIQLGNKSVLQWDTQHAFQVRLNGRLVTLDGKENVRPENRTSYTLIALNEIGETDSETIEVDVVTPPPQEPLPNEAENKTETAQTDYYPPAKVSLRPEPAILSDDELKKILTAKSLYAKFLNPNVKDFPNEFEARNIQSHDVVVDYATRLMWNRHASESIYTWYKAGNHVKELNAKRYAGYSDWRMPTVEEIASLMEITKSSGGGYIDSIFIPEAVFDCWTADRKKYDTAQDTAWMAGFSYGGFIHGGHAKNPACVLAVRSAP